MIKRWLILLLSLWIIPSIAAVELQVDRDNIASDEIITLVISSKDHATISPDLSPLKKDFEVVGTNRSSQFSILNGSTQMQTQWQIALLPKHEGDILIPEITVGNEKTPSRVIHVMGLKKNVASTPSANADIFFEASIIPKDIYIQEQVIYTMKLYFNQAIENPYLAGPGLADAKITQNGQDIIYTSTKNGKSYHVLERSYLITPKNTGHFEITPPFLKGYLEESMNRINVYGFQSHGLKPFKVQGPTLAISVKPKPTGFKGDWFPAQKLTIKESWEPNPVVFREGEPVTRIVEINAEGATGDQIPNLVLSSGPNLNSYPQQAKRETAVNGETQVGKLTQKIVYIPTKLGEVTLPAIKMPWWSSTIKKEQVAVLPAKKVTVLPALLKNSANTSNPLPTQPVALPTTVKPKLEPVNSSPKSAKFNFWPILAVMALSAWAITLLLLSRQRRLGYLFKINHKQPAQSLAELQKQLREACDGNKAKLARSLFLSWSALYWRDSSLHALSDIVRLLSREQAIELKNEIMQLEAIFYSRNKITWNGPRFWQAFRDYLNLKQATQTATKDPLPPLNFPEEGNTLI